jgi:hypothetical protein
VACSLDGVRLVSDISTMTASLAPAHSRAPTRRNPLGRYSPKSLSKASRWRFVRDRRSGYLARLPGAPTDQQSATIESLISLEWAAIVAEAEGGLVGLRESREHRRLFQKLLSDLEQSLAPPPEPRPRGRPRVGPPQITLEEHLAMLRQRQEGAT